MLTKRIIPCLDIKDGRTVKGVNFENIRDAGDPVELGALYAQEGADELVFLDITATNEKRKTLSALVNRISHHINIPFTVGGGVSSIDDASILLHNGADKVSVNTAAFKNPQLVADLAKEFGSQFVVLAIDTKQEEDGEWYVYLNGGRVKTDIKCYDWAKQAVEAGAGEILLTSMNNDGTKKGFALDITRRLSEHLAIPVIASGGAGTMQHFTEVFEEGAADAALAASIFHFKEISIPELKRYLQQFSTSNHKSLNPNPQIPEFRVMNIDFKKYSDGLVPAIIQDAETRVVLMLGFMNKEAFNKTKEIGKVTFYSRSKQRLWTKGEESGHFLLLQDIQVDCDNDTLLVKVNPVGPVCHTGADTCFSEANKPGFLMQLEQIIGERKQAPAEESYVARMFAKGLNKIAQKVGEEAVEMVIEAKDNNDSLFLDESADLLFHYLMLLNAKGFTLQQVINILEERHKK
ncbi:phosphoribosyl-ATP pyrophosphatase [Russula earlei]|uniref:Phosphoribosyl-ATP pyrophosphatase n=1 Tax=Russula earlei TaxID=71964 RepID=A0ACC0TWQ0_9AGAM|nr:phosphoribosyl-ATP pyrophosphatase [Russula earlei]